MCTQPQGYTIFTTLLDPDTWTQPVNFEMYQYLDARNINVAKEELSSTPELVQGILFVDIYTGSETIGELFHDLH